MKFIIMMLLFSTQAMALTPEQQQVKQIAKSTGENNCFDICFTKTLQAIAWQESSFGVSIVGDSRGQRFYFMHQGKTVTVHKSKTFIEDDIRYTFFEVYGEKYLKKVYSEVFWKPLNQSSLGPFQIKVSTARDVITKMKLTRFMSLLSNEKSLINKLLHDTHFSATMALNFLQWNYQRTRRKNPWRYAVSKYNGGSNNLKYINKITEKIRRLK